MRILIFMNNMDAGGAEYLALDLTRGLVANRAEVIIASARPGGRLLGQFEQSASKVYAGLAPSRLSLAGPWRVAKIIKQHRIDIVIVLDVIRTGMFHALLGSGSSGQGLKRILWAHTVPGRHEGRADGFLLRLIEKCRLLDATICVSEYLANELTRMGMCNHVMAVHNGIDVDSFARATAAEASEAKKHRIICVANFMPHKDYPTLLKAAGIMATKRDDLELICVGRGTDSERFGMLARKYGAAGVLRPLGEREDVPNLLKSADVFVLATLRETFGLAVVEAMAASLPVVTTDVPAFVEVFTDGVEGLKTPARSSDRLAAAVERVIDNPSLAMSLASKGARRAHMFDRRKMLERWMRIIRTLAPRSEC